MPLPSAVGTRQIYVVSNIYFGTDRVEYSCLTLKEVCADLCLVDCQRGTDECRVTIGKHAQ